MTRRGCSAKKSANFLHFPLDKLLLPAYTDKKQTFDRE